MIPDILSNTSGMKRCRSIICGAYLRAGAMDKERQITQQSAAYTVTVGIVQRNSADLSRPGLEIPPWLSSV